MIPAIDRRTIRALAGRWRELSEQPVMSERKRQWTAVHDLRMERPMILVETATVDGFVGSDEILCTDPLFRAVELNMRDAIRHAEDVGDDVVLEPWFRTGWNVDATTFGVDVVTTPAEVADGEVALGYTFNFPIREPADVALLRDRIFTVDRSTTLTRQRMLEDVFGDILPVRVANHDHFGSDPGNEVWVGTFFAGLTWQIYRFIGNDALHLWLYDEPDAIRRLVAYMTDDRERLFRFLEDEGVLAPNTDNQMSGPRAYGYVSSLPGPDAPGPARLGDLWCWAESQETTGISPAMFAEFFLPALARMTRPFGHVYYGCCEPVHDRLEMVMAAMPNLRSVSVSPWADMERVGELLGRDYVYSRKPNAAFMSGLSVEWDLVERDLRRTRDAARDGNLEVLFRDLYVIEGDRPRLARWVALARSVLEA